MKMQRLAKALLFTMAIAAHQAGATASHFYVATDGNDSADGSSSTPWRTIGKAINHTTTPLLSYGDTIHIKAGTYRERVVLDSTTDILGSGSTSNRLTFRAWDFNSDNKIDDSEKPTITPAVIPTTWTAVNDGSTWTSLSTATFQSNTIFYTDWSATTGDTIHLVVEGGTNALQQTGWSETVGSEGTPTLVTHMTAGSYRHDSTSNRLYVWKSNGQQPSTGEGSSDRIEVLQPTTPASYSNLGPFITHAKANIAAVGLILRYSNAFKSSVKPGVTFGTGALVDMCDIQWMDYQGLSAYSNSEIRSTTIANCGSTGLNAPGTNVVVSYCIISTNNFRGFSDNDNAGGIKIMTSAEDVSGTRLEHNVVRDNKGHGIWFDTMGALNLTNPAVINGNTVANNTGFGIFLEQSWHFDVINNLVINNLRSGIAVQWSPMNLIANNTVVAPFVEDSGSRPLCFVLWTPTRSDPYTNNAGIRRNCDTNFVIGNVFIQHSDQAVIRIGKDSTNANSRFKTNTYIENYFYCDTATKSYSPIQFNLVDPSNENNLEVYTTLNWTEQEDINNRIYDSTQGTLFLGSNYASPYDYQPHWNSPLVDHRINTLYLPPRDLLNNTRDSHPDAGAIESMDINQNGVHDTWEMFYFGSTNVVTSISDADSDGVSDMQEFIRRTIPTNSASKSVTFYVSAATGLDTFNGLYETPINLSAGKGPKKTLTSTLSNSVAGDELRVAAGSYSENLRITSPNVRVVIGAGTVKLN